MAPPAKLIVRDLRKRYGTTEAVRGVSFAVGAGEICGLLGPNGAGKTTTVECIVGLRAADSGEVRVSGINPRERPSDAKQKLGVALQSTALQEKITPREALRLFGALYRSPATANALEELLARFALIEKADARYETLSGGQRQKLALALAFVNRPEVVLLDEPTAGLDARARSELHAEIAQMKRDGCAVLLTTHDLREAETLCDRVAILHRGEIVASGPPREMTAKAGMRTLEELFLALTGEERTESEA